MPDRLRHALRTIMISAMLLGASVAGGGCMIAALVGGMAESYRESSTRAVAADYDGLRGKSFAVLVAVDRFILGDFPDLQAIITARVTDRLRDPANTGATGFVPYNAVMEFQLSNPSWASWNYAQLAEELGVERIVMVDVSEFRLREPGNAYLWEGIAIARVGIVEADTFLADEFAWTRDIQVGFPDGEGFGPQDYSESIVRSALLARLIDRVSWLMYEHQEPYYPDY